VWDASSMTKESLKNNSNKTFYSFVILKESQELFISFVLYASSMTKESLNIIANNTFYSFVIPEEFQGLFS
jgi:hypothetical protein